MKRQATTDADGYICVTTETWIGSRYKIVASLGEGVFGRVVKAYDALEPSVPKAIKVVNYDSQFKECAEMEILCLNTFKKAPSKITNCIADLLRTFDFNKHACLVMPVYGRNIYTFLSDNNFRGFPLYHCQKMCFQLLTAVDYMHRCGLIHTDIKPENLLIKTDKWIERSDEYSTYQMLLDPSIVLSDFNTVRNQSRTGGTIQTINYRAPEVILDLDWDHSVDNWSIGCVFVDIFLGSTLFGAPTDGSDLSDKLSQLHNICTYCGPIPYHMLRMTNVPEFINFQPETLITSDQDCVGNPFHHTKPFKPLKKLIKRLLVIDPNGRIPCALALNSSFFDILNESCSQQLPANIPNVAPVEDESTQEKISKCVQERNSSVRSSISTASSEL